MCRQIFLLLLHEHCLPCRHHPACPRFGKATPALLHVHQSHRVPQFLRPPSLDFSDVAPVSSGSPVGFFLFG